MFAAATFAFADSINALLIAVIVGVGIMLPRGQYKKVTPLLIAGDWMGVFVLSLITMRIFVGLAAVVRRTLESPIFGMVLIALGVVTALLTLRSRPTGEPSPLVQRLLEPLQQPTAKTFFTGMVLGLVQSITSVPFFGGIAVLAGGDFSNLVRYGGMFAYASVALSLPTAVAIGVGYVRRKPHSQVGQAFTWARNNPATVSKVGGYVVATFLVGLGIAHL
ncbi:hypothetical protein [Corynebacterium tapiri]|uniref:GAP family protein n=1 Tax=Corynebacterium tapiri TaxID=1448266 RepID=A0A5C4U6R9_9CORY|nr:hypothetical protein [Corynebacterium tapiri]TNM00454.1 hypothetical protein FHE74_00440 [Corynebacterium tapiri]